VDTAALGPLAVTNAKIASGAVSRDKMANPLVQAANTIVGGLRVTETTSTYISSWWVDASGNVGHTANAAATVFFLTQTNNLIVGTSIPTAGLQSKLTIAQPSAAAASGLAFVDLSNTANRATMFVTGATGLLSITCGSATYNMGTSDFYPSTNGSHNLGGTSNRWGAFWTNTATITSNATIGGTLGVTGNTTINGTLGVSGTTTFAGLTTGAITCTTINTQNNTITAGAISCTSLTTNSGTLNTSNITDVGTLSVAGATTLAGLTCTTINTQGNTITAGAVSCTSLTTNSGTLNTSNITDVGTLSVAGATTLAGLTCGAVTCTTINTQGNTVTAGNSSFSQVASNDVRPTADNTGAVGQPGQRYSGGYFVGLFDADGVLGTVSDERFKIKASFRKIPYGLSTILALPPATSFQYKQSFGVGDRPRWGYKAQDLQKIVPELVEEQQWALEPDGEPEPILTAKPGLLLYIAIEAIRELAARVEELENRRN
jgi:hypothetical protein